MTPQNIELREALAELEEWKNAVQSVCKNVQIPDDVDGWLVDITEVEELLPEHIRKAGCAQSPLEGIMALVEENDLLHDSLEKRVSEYCELLDELNELRSATKQAIEETGVEIALANAIADGQDSKERWLELTEALRRLRQLTKGTP